MKFDVAINAELRGYQTDVHLIYRSNRIDESFALEAAKTYETAIQYLMSDVLQDCYSSQALYNAFFCYRTGGQIEQVQASWRARLQDIEAVPFPILPNPSFNLTPSSLAEYTMNDISILEGEKEATVAVWTAWALLISAYTNTNDVTFGAVMPPTVKAPSLHTFQTKEASTIVPVRMKITPGLSVSQALGETIAIYEEITQYHGITRHWIRQLGEDGERACGFQSTLQVRRYTDCTLPTRLTETPPSDERFALQLCCQITENTLGLTTRYDHSIIDTEQIYRMIRQMEGILRQVLRVEHQIISLGEIHTASKEDLAEIWSWNAAVPETRNSCVHDLFAEVAAGQPEAPAICAWDGNLTYHQLDTLSTILSHRLVSLGAGRGTLVPLCFEKSMWMPVAILGVMKAGAASVAMDTTNPEARLSTIIQQVSIYSKRLLIVSSKMNEDLSRTLARTSTVEVEVVVPETMDLMARDRASIGPQTLDTAGVDPTAPILARPDDMLYVVFTSGSTGIPKGAIISHKNFSSAIYHQKTVLAYKKESRVFDFASYAFDVAWSNLLHTLTAGGCLCIPNQSDRQDNVIGAIQELKATYVHLTPTIGRLIRSSQIPTVRTVVFSGEALSAWDIHHWDTVDLALNTYGPAECTVTNTVANLYPGEAEQPGIGRGSGTVTWVVRLDGSALAAIGEVGELWLEGPLIGKGYLGDPQRTAATFIQDPSWLVQGGGPKLPGRRGRLYRTGDLVSYKSDGSLQFIGRRDNQVKIRGQRLELGEVEYHIKHILASTTNAQVPDVQVIAEVVSPRRSPSPVLVAFISCPGNVRHSEDSLKLAIAELTRGLNDALRLRLPSHMIPSTYVPISAIPTTTTGKIDRRQLRQTAEGLDLVLLAGTSTLKAPSDETESILARSWADVLGVPYERISIDTSFTALGGDSISAMQVLTRLREQRVRLKVGDILRHRTIEKIAPKCQFIADTPIASISSELSLLKLSKSELDAVITQLADLNIRPEDVLELLPCTPLQEGILLAIAKKSATYHVVKIWNCQSKMPSITVKVDKLASAWEKAIDIHSIFSMIFVESARLQGFIQVNLTRGKSPIQIQKLPLVRNHPEHTLKTMERPAFSASEPPYLVTLCEASTGEVACRLDISHALIDAISFPIILDHVAKAYDDDQAVHRVPKFRSVLQEITRPHSDTKQHYWRTYLAGVEPCWIPVTFVLPVENSTQELHVDLAIASSISDQIDAFCRAKDLTRSTFLQVSWAMVLSQLTRKHDVCFGYLASGRDLAVQGVEATVGPLINVLISRVNLGVPATVALAEAGKHLVNHFEFQHVSLAKLQGDIGRPGQQLFNTGLTVRQGLSSDQSNSTLSFEEAYGEDPNEVCRLLLSSHLYIAMNSNTLTGKISLIL